MTFRHRHSGWGRLIETGEVEVRGREGKSGKQEDGA
jgi:hypothetical protein